MGIKTPFEGAMGSLGRLRTAMGEGRVGLKSGWVGSLPFLSPLYLLSQPFWACFKMLLFFCCSLYPTHNPSLSIGQTSCFLLLHGEEQENHVPTDGARTLGPHLQLKPEPPLLRTRL